MLLIDDRENPVIIQKTLAMMGDASISKKGEAQVQRLQSADYVVGTCGIEAKEINDLYHSILGHGRSRTIVGQLVQLQETFDEPMLVVYGKKLKPMIRGQRLSGNPALREIARMVSVIKDFKKQFYANFPNIRYMEFDNMNDMVQFLAHHHFQKKIGGVAKPVLKPAKSHMDDRVAALSAVKGVSVKNAQDLLDKFGSLPKILRTRTTQKQLMAVKGIGRKKAKAILDLRNSV
jgi:ERCC4-type nuclease